MRDPRIREVVLAAYLAALVACAAPPAQREATSFVAPAPAGSTAAWNAQLWDV